MFWACFLSPLSVPVPAVSCVDNLGWASFLFFAVAWTSMPTLTHFKEKLDFCSRSVSKPSWFQPDWINIKRWQRHKALRNLSEKPMTQWHRHPNLCLQVEKCRKQPMSPSKPAMGHQNNLFHIEQISQIQAALSSKTSGLETSGKSMWEAESNKKLDISAHNSGIQLHRKIHSISSAAQGRKLAFYFWRDASWIPILVWHQDLNASTKFFKESTWYEYNLCC